jgi:hypothetical protein
MVDVPDGFLERGVAFEVSKFLVASEMWGRAAVPDRPGGGPPQMMVSPPLELSIPDCDPARRGTISSCLLIERLVRGPGLQLLSILG